MNRSEFDYIYYFFSIVSSCCEASNIAWWKIETNHKNMTLAIAAIVSAVAMTAVAFAVPQQAFAYRHRNHNNSNSIKVSQDITQT